MIKKAKLKKSIDGNENECILITYDDHPRVWSVPFDPANSMYQEYLEWVAEGNTAEEAD